MTSDLKIVTVKLPVDIVEELDLLARREGRSRSELIREALIKYLLSVKSRAWDER